MINQIWRTSWSSKITYLYNIIYLQNIYIYVYYRYIIHIASINHSIYLNIFQPFQLLHDFVYPIILQHTLSFWQSFILQNPKPLEYKLQAVHVHAWTCNVASTKKSTFIYIRIHPRLDIMKHVYVNGCHFFRSRPCFNLAGHFDIIPTIPRWFKVRHLRLCPWSSKECVAIRGRWGCLEDVESYPS